VQFSNGILCSFQTVFTNGKVQNGEYFFLDENNNTILVTFENGFLSSKKFKDNRLEHYYENGQKKDECILDEYDKINGSFTSWWSNGNKRSEGRKISGKQEGKFTVWFENGSLNSESTFSEDLINGESIVYDENGGKTISYYEKGKLINRKSEKEENLVSNNVSSSNDFIFFCISGADNDTTFIKLRTNDNSSYDRFKSQIVTEILSNMYARFHLTRNYDDGGYGRNYISYFYELSDVTYSTKYVSYKSKCVDKNMKVYDCTKSGYTAACHYILTLSDAARNIIYNGNANFTTTDKLYQKDVYSDTQDDAIYKVSKNANSEYAVYHFFPIKSFISDLGKVRGGTKVKTVVISAGTDFGVYKGLEFNVIGFDSWTSKNVQASLVVDEINSSTSVCKVKSGDEEIYNMFISGRRIKIISTR